MRRWAARAAEVALAVLCLTARARADDESTRYTLRAEAGAEYDSNAHRTETVQGVASAPAVGSGLWRGVVTGALSDIIAPRQDIAVSATAAGKLFQEAAARDEDVAIAESSLRWRVGLSTRTHLALSGGYYEAFQRGDPGSADDIERRDFRSITAGLRLGLRTDPGVELGLAAGYRLFVFKPDRDFDFRAPTAAVDARWARETADGEAEWEASTGAAYERRDFGGPAFTETCVAGDTTCLPAPGPDLRHDDFLSAHLELTRTGSVMLGAGYVFQYNFSNSLGDTVNRHFITARFAAALPLAIYLTARAEVLFARYPQGTIVGQFDSGRTFASIEDENRSSARLDLSRNLTERVQLVARYTFYGPALTGTPVSYRRQTALLSLAFTIDK